MPSCASLRACAAEIFPLQPSNLINPQPL
jgi:hypothetical protein